MLTEKMLTELNKQVQAEIYSAYLYLSMSASMESKNLKGIANWFKMQWKEELSHGMKLFDFVNNNGGKIELMEIQKPQTDWSSPLDAFQATYDHEINVTKLIHSLMETAQQEKDVTTQEMLQWFVKEQVEEEENSSELLEKLKTIGDDKKALLDLDRELSNRQFTDETKEE
jgi:ferritin